MTTARREPEIFFPEGFDDRWEQEIPLKGYLCDVTVRLEGGQSYLVNFIDPVRLSQDLEEEAKAGRPYFAEPGLIVLPEVTTQAIIAAVKSLWNEGFFGNLETKQAGPEIGTGEGRITVNIPRMRKGAG